MPTTAVTVQVVQGPLASPALARAAGAMAARCDLPVDRLEDAVLVLDVLLEGRTRDDVLVVVLDTVADTLTLRAGPFADGEPARLAGVQAPGTARPVFDALAGGATADGDHLELVIAPARPQSSVLL